MTERSSNQLFMLQNHSQKAKLIEIRIMAEIKIDCLNEKCLQQKTSTTEKTNKNGIHFALATFNTAQSTTIDIWFIDSGTTIQSTHKPD